MVEHTYSGPAIDLTWQDFEDRPYRGRGETVEVIDSRLDTDIPDQDEDAVVIPAEFYLQSTEFCVYETIADLSETTPREVMEQADVSRQTVYNQIHSLAEAGLIETEEHAAAHGATLIRLAVPVDSRFRFEDGVSSDLLPSKTHPLRIPPKRRRILAYTARNPTRTQTEIADEFETSQGYISRTFKEHGDPRRDIDTKEIQRAKISLGHTNRRLANVESEIAALEEKREALREKREKLQERLSARNRLALVSDEEAGDE